MMCKNICKDQSCGPRGAGFTGMGFQVLKSSHMKEDAGVYVMKDSRGVAGT